ncbi:UrcA family protein [Sphingomonas edaphi]|jgi:UrcA family protein|uniref:UrcA family protein n=1 Tax=Sphingomonas edaphi TaxID=2315689 RepID=A0A418Q0R2_9SPHN|nr:UrcA family protein [Sphingomonas edaphi]RIX31509.1 UrcA family protein [Sphingomonas edaphi]
MSKLALISAAALFVGSSLSAQPVVVRANPENLPTIRVSFADLNLASTSGQSRLKHRIGRAAADVCEYNHSRMPLEEELDALGCFKQARAGGLLQMNDILEKGSWGSAFAANTIVITRM